MIQATLDLLLASYQIIKHRDPASSLRSVASWHEGMKRFGPLYYKISPLNRRLTVLGVMRGHQFSFSQKPFIFLRFFSTVKQLEGDR